MKIQFKGTRTVPFFDGFGERWKDGEIRSVNDIVGLRLLGLYESQFKVASVVEVKKEIAPETDKMIRGGTFTKKKTTTKKKR